MQIEIINETTQPIAHVTDNRILIADVPSALDFMTTVKYRSGCESAVLAKERICESFFKLSSGLAGEILQKFVNYRFRIAFYGDFSCYTSKPLKDFIYESNNGTQVFFAADLEEAIEKLSAKR